jgi:AcrR family transcriptional regulator
MIQERRPGSPRAAALKPRKAPAQQRSAVTIETILQAAALVLQKHSLAGFNTNRVAEVAGVSVGSLYQYFPNKDALVASLIERAQQALLDRLQAALAEARGRPLEEGLHLLVKMAIANQFDAPLLAAALDHEERRLPLRSLLQSTQQQMLMLLSGFMAEHAHELQGSDPVRQARDAMTIAKGMVEADIEGAGAPELAELEERAVRALLGYLRGPSAEPAATRSAGANQRSKPSARRSQT